MERWTNFLVLFWGVTKINNQYVIIIDRIGRGEHLLKQQTKCDGRDQKSFT